MDGLSGCAQHLCGDGLVVFGSQKGLVDQRVLCLAPGLGNIAVIPIVTWIHFAQAVIQGDAALTNLDGLEYLREVRGNVTVRQNDLMTSIAGIMQIEAVSGSVTIRQNGSLCNDDAQAFVDQVNPGGGSALQQNGGDCQ